MEKEKLIKKVDIFMDQARQANCYFSIIKQFAENRTNYYEEMSLSSAFYSYTYNALVVATILELSKIYDRNRQSSNIKDLLKECKENKHYFPTSHPKHEVIIGDETHEFFSPFQHDVIEDEREFFQVEIENLKPFTGLFNFDRLPIRVDMTLDRYFELYEWRLQKLEVQIENLLKQRNKVYAHNDEATMKIALDDIINSHPLNHKEINKLISFALDFSRFACAMLTGVNRAATPVNIDDWENTLLLAKLGEKYKEVEIQKQIDKLEKE